MGHCPAGCQQVAVIASTCSNQPRLGLATLTCFVEEIRLLFGAAHAVVCLRAARVPRHDRVLLVLLALSHVSAANPTSTTKSTCAYTICTARCQSDACWSECNARVGPWLPTRRFAHLGGAVASRPHSSGRGQRRWIIVLPAANRLLSSHQRVRANPGLVLRP